MSAYGLRIEDYGLIGNTFTAALVGRNGSIDWLCLPHFDSGACFASLLGTPDNGRWLLAPACEAKRVTRRYRPGTMVLETEFETEEGTASLIDFMPIPESEERVDLIRLVVGKEGSVPMRLDLAFRFDYGHIKPWVRRIRGGLSAIAGPDAVELRTPVEMHGEDFRTVGGFTVHAGETVPFSLVWHRSHWPAPPPLDCVDALRETERWWRGWCGEHTYEGPWQEAVERSLLTLKALTFSPTGGIVAAPTTSLPEKIGGVRNWDYRYCWLRDATLTLYSLLISGHKQEARDWREWLLRAVAGEPSQLNIMYGIAGERRLDEVELPWLSGYENSRPVRIGNGAYAQFQLDVYGEVLDAFYAARRFGIEPMDDAWQVQKVLLDFVESNWDKPDEGIWEVRGPRRHFTHSKVMAWVAMDRAIKTVERFGGNGAVDRWRLLRDRIHADVCEKGVDPERGVFVQYYGSKELDAALLLIPLVGFLPADDPRVVATIESIERELTVDGLVRRYSNRNDVDGLPGEEGAFLVCTFWLADALAMIGRRAEAVAIFEHLLELRNDLGLLAEEYDPRANRQLGNFPQAFSHIGLINTAHNLRPQKEAGPAERHESGVPDRAAREHVSRGED